MSSPITNFTISHWSRSFGLCKAMHASVIGSIWATILCSLKMRVSLDAESEHWGVHWMTCRFKFQWRQWHVGFARCNCNCNESCPMIQILVVSVLMYAVYFWMMQCCQLVTGWRVVPPSHTWREQKKTLLAAGATYVTGHSMKIYDV